MWAAGKTRVDRYQESLPQSVMSLPEQAPVVHSSAVDMPKRPDAQSVLYDNISREVGAISREAATKRGVEAAEEMTAQEFVQTHKGAGGIAGVTQGRRSASLGLGTT